MRILVTGGGGFAGQHLLRELLPGESNVVGATTVESVPPILPEDLRSAVEWLTMDIRSAESVEAVIGTWKPDVIYHLAGQASVGGSFEAPLDTWDINATGTLRVMMAMGSLSGAGKRLLLVSSAEIYGDVAPDRQPIGEDTAPDPVTPYGASKGAAEVAALNMGKVCGIDVVVARSFNHIGPGQSGRFVLPSIALQLAHIRSGDQAALVQIGNAEVIRDFLDVRDAVRAYVILMQRAEPGGVYNVCSGIPRSLRAVIDRLVELSGTGARLEVDPSRVRPVDISKLVGDPARIQKLGWSTVRPLDDSLRDLLSEAESRV